MDPLVEEVVPGLSFAVFKRSITVRFPFLEKRSSAIVLTKVGAESFLKAAPEDHRCPRLLFPPPIQVAVAIAARAAQVLTDLRVAIDHCCLPAHRCRRVKYIRVPPSLPRGQRHRGFGKSARSELYRRSGRPHEVCKALFRCSTTVRRRVGFRKVWVPKRQIGSLRMVSVDAIGSEPYPREQGTILQAYFRLH